MNKSAINIQFSKDYNSVHLIPLLNQYQQIIHSCVGPLNSRLKFISKFNDPTNFVITNTSRNILDYLYKIPKCNEIDSNILKWQFDLIRNVLQNGHFNQLYDSGLFLLHLVNQFLIDQNQIDKNLIDSFLEKLTSHLVSDNNFIKVKLDLNNISYLRNFLQTIFESKCLIRQLDETKKTKFIDLCLKLFINSFNKTKFNRILYFYDTNYSYGLEESLFINGILFKIDHLNENMRVLIENKSRSKLKCILFECSLSGDFDYFDSQSYKFEIESDQLKVIKKSNMIVDMYKKMFDNLIENTQVDLILCQKVIHPSLKEYLLDKGVLTVDRLSLMLMEPLSELTECKICYHLHQLNESQVGYLSSISIFKHLNNTYLHFQNQSSNIQTFLVTIQNENIKNEIESIIQVAENSFKRTIINGAFFCGGPCFYTYILTYLWKLVSKSQSENRSLNIKLINYFKHIFISFVHKLLDQEKKENYVLSLDNGHCFYEKSESRCICGLVEIEDSTFIDLNDLNSLNIIIDCQNILNQPLKKICQPILLDCYESKLNVFKLTRDLISTISNIGVFIYNN